MIPHPLSRPVGILGPLAGIALAFLAGCAYSSSETPRPLEPDYERLAREQKTKTAAQRGEAETEAETAPELIEDDPRAPAAIPPSSWGK